MEFGGILSGWAAEHPHRKIARSLDLAQSIFSLRKVWINVTETVIPKKWNLNKYYKLQGACVFFVLKQDKWLNSTITHYIEVSLQVFEMELKLKLSWNDDTMILIAAGSILTF
jgi:hypothetical protein